MVRQKKKFDVVYICPVEFPDGGAAAKRILNVARTLKLLGLNVLIISGSRSLNETCLVHDDIEIYRINERSLEHYPKVIRYLGYIFFGRKSVSLLDKLNVRPRFVFVYAGYTPYLLNILWWSRKNQSRVIFDAVEWYKPNNIWGFCNPYYWNIEFAMRFLLPRCDGLICISKYLETYYSRTQVPLFRMPPTFKDTSVVIRSIEFTPSEIILVYAGSPEKKDELKAIISAVINFKSKKLNIHLRVVGISPEDARHLYGENKNNRIVFLGRVKHNVALEHVSRAHFTVLLRKNTIPSAAGFPTKVVESLSLGVPVICNETSDLSSVIEDNINGIRVDGYSSNALIKALKSLEDLSASDYSKLRLNARKTAEDKFLFSAYKTPLANFLERVEKKDDSRVYR